MGSNSRHGSDVSQAAVNEVTARPKPIGLTPAEIGDAITEAREPIELESWVRYPQDNCPDLWSCSCLDHDSRMGRVHNPFRRHVPRVGLCKCSSAALDAHLFAVCE